VKRLAKRATIVLGAAGACWSVAVLSIPRSVGVRLLGPDWSATRPSQVAFAFLVVAQAVAIGPAVALRALERPRVLVGVRLVAMPVVLVLGVVLTTHLGAVGTASAVLSGEAITAVGVCSFVWRLRR
jgi:O-antigen/teichoic acid export membrane protein